MGSWKESKAITKQTFGVVKSNPYMLLYPVVAGVVSLVAFFIVAGAGLAGLGINQAEGGEIVSEDGDVSTVTMITGIVVLVIAAYLATLITQICMGGLVKSADEEMQGHDSNFGAGMSAAFGRLGPLMGRAAIQTLVDWILSLIRGDGDGNPIVSILRLVLASLMAVAGALISFFVLPLIMLRGKGPIEAIKESVSLLRKNWGKQLEGGIRIGGLVFLVGVLPGVVALIGGILVSLLGDNLVLGIPLASIGVIVVILAQVLVSALRAVFSVALLHHAEDGQALGPYAPEQLHSALRTKR